MSGASRDQKCLLLDVGLQCFFVLAVKATVEMVAAITASRALLTRKEPFPM